MDRHVHFGSRALTWLKRWGVLLAAVALTALTSTMVAGLFRSERVAKATELALVEIRADVDAQQAAPLAPPAAQPGVRVAMAAARTRIDASLAGLARTSPTPELETVRALVRRNLAGLAQVQVAVAAGGPEFARKKFVLPDGTNPILMAGAKARSAFRDAEGVYHAQADEALMRAELGAAAGSLILLLAFGFYFVRAVKARDTTDRLIRENRLLLETSQLEALTDALTGLANRRGLSTDLERRIGDATAGRESLVLALFDLNGFKQYNDTFGHPAGDALLRRLSQRLTETMDGLGSAYRLGGDEFCVLAEAGSDGGETTARLAAAALCEEGGTFTIDASYGLVRVPEEASTSPEALRVADQRMYAQKATGRRSAARQSTDVLLRVLEERSGLRDADADGVSRRAETTAQALGLGEQEVEDTRLAAELHDVGKAAVPDAVLGKKGPLDEGEWALMRRHTLVAERIILAAPSLAHTAATVRSTHERWDGTGYPDSLAGEAIPLAARVIAVCDAFHAMTSERPYRASRGATAALAELQACAGTQFDPRVVAAFAAQLAAARRVPAAS